MYLVPGTMLAIAPGTLKTLKITTNRAEPIRVGINGKGALGSINSEKSLSEFLMMPYCSISLLYLQVKVINK